MNNDAFVKSVASRLIEQIRNGTAPWQKPWRQGTSFLPFNPTNGTRYTRLNRDLSDPFGSIGYAREELRAEIASMIIGSELEIGYDPGQHAAYAASWIQILEH